MEDTGVPSWSNLSSFKTPLRVLVQQFLASRERWKLKCKALQEKATTYRIELRDLRRSRDHWKNKAKSLAKEMAKERRASHKQRPTAQESSPGAAGPPPAQSSSGVPPLGRSPLGVPLPARS
jgi:hypothetical protein